MRAVWLVLLAGCNAVFGLDSTTTIDDLDGDGVDDDVDNCKMTPNDQQDTDGDGKGDACDFCTGCLPCDRGADHDEDRDLIADGCDNCPALANADQANGDGDELGDVCDDGPTYERRLLFDGFATLGAEWLESGAQWEVMDDDIGPLPSTTSIRTLEHSVLELPIGRWSIEIGLVPMPPDRMQGMYARDATWCKLVHAPAGPWLIEAGGTSGAQFQLAPAETIRFRVTPSGPVGAQRIACAIPGVAAHTDTAYELEYPFHPRLWTRGEGLRFRYIDITSE